MERLTKTMQHYLQPPARFTWAGFGACAALVCCAIGAGWEARRLFAADAVLAQRIAKVSTETAIAPTPSPSKIEIEHRKRWMELQAERNFAWSPLFVALERAGNTDIELLEFHPDKSNGTVLLRGEAKDEAALLDFVEALALNPVFRHVYLSHQKNRQRDRLITVAFELKAVLSTTASTAKQPPKINHPH